MNDAQRSARSIYSRRLGATATTAYYLRNGADVNLVNMISRLVTKSTDKKGSSFDIAEAMNQIGGHIKMIRLELKEDKNSDISRLLRIVYCFYRETYIHRKILQNKQLGKLIYWGELIEKLIGHEAFIQFDFDKMVDAFTSAYTLVKPPSKQHNTFNSQYGILNKCVEVLGLLHNGQINVGPHQRKAVKWLKNVFKHCDMTDRSQANKVRNQAFRILATYSEDVINAATIVYSKDVTPPNAVRGYWVVNRIIKKLT